MAQKRKNKKSKISPWYILTVLLIVFLYYQYANSHQLITREHGNYTSVTEINESNDFNNPDALTTNSSNFEIYFWDVGQADCTLVVCDNHYMLIDAGNNADGKLIVNELKELGIKKIDYLIGTHPHEDHIGGLDNIIEQFKIGKFYMPNRQADSMTFEDILNATAEKNLKITTPKKGKKFYLGQAGCQIISVESDAEDTNDSSIVIQVTYGKHQYLFTGDLTSNMEAKIDWEDIDVLKVAHHGSQYSSSQEFLNATKPEVAIISDGINNEYGHPHQQTLNRLKKINSKIYRTDKNGTIHLTSNGKKITIECLEISLDGNEK